VVSTAGADVVSTGPSVSGAGGASHAVKNASKSAINDIKKAFFIF
jgi:hypothetical protein